MAAGGGALRWPPAGASLTLAVREVARGADWKTTIRFFKEVAEQQQSEAQHMMVAQLARDLGRRDLGVIVGQAAAARGYLDFQHIAFPLIPVPQGHESKWTAIHAISRQESQFAQNAMKGRSQWQRLERGRGHVSNFACLIPERAAGGVDERFG